MVAQRRRGVLIPKGVNYKLQAGARSELGDVLRVRQPPRSLNLPPQSEVERRILYHVNALSRPVEPRHLYGLIADDFNLTAEQRRATRPNGDPDWHYLVRQAQQRLVELGFIDDSRKYVWNLTNAGRVAARGIQSENDLWPDQSSAD